MIWDDLWVFHKKDIIEKMKISLKRRLLSKINILKGHESNLSLIESQKTKEPDWSFVFQL